MMHCSLACLRLAQAAAGALLKPRWMDIGRLPPLKASRVHALVLGLKSAALVPCITWSDELNAVPTVQSRNRRVHARARVGPRWIAHNIDLLSPSVVC